MGDPEFECAVWGTTTGADDHYAKRVGGRVDARDLNKITLPRQIHWPRSDGVDRKGWFYNVAHDGTLRLSLTRRGISDAHWQLLLLALRIQIRHAAFGSRDQWGLGVLAIDDLPTVEPLTAPMGNVNPLPDRPGLHHAFFVHVTFNDPLPLDWRARLEQGLRWREKLRNSFRPGMHNLRHYLFGELGQYGSAINVSALYPHGQGCALRIWGVIPHTTPPQFDGQRGQVVQTLRQAMNQGPDEVWPGESEIVWQDDAEHQADLATWINQRAGVVI
ncbi:MAG TPA: hypothetical protein DEP36_10950 [Gammaproteobacteria bacterium]|nr:hypothetical protein [Gammaproteobacteria bacterium]